MEATIQRQSIVYRPLGILLVSLGLAVLWALFPGPPSVLALIAITITFIIGLKEPIWTMVALLIAQFTIPSYMVGVVSLRLILLFFTGLLLLRAHIKDNIQLGKNARRTIIPVLILVVVSLLANLFNSSFDFVFKDFRNFFGGLLIVIFLPAIIKDLKDLKLLGGVALIVLTASTIVAIMQHYNILGTQQFLMIGGRAQGFSENELELSYLLGVAIMAILGVYIFKGMKTGRHRLLIPAILMLPALYFTYTRSALLALAFGLVSFFLLYKIRIRSEIIIVAILLVTLYLSISGATDNFAFGARSDVGQEASSISRKILWQAGIAIAIDNPVLGIGGDRYESVAPQYTESVDPSLTEWEEDRYYSYRTLGNVGIHNDFLNMWVSYGIVALIAFIWIIIVVMRNCYDSFRISKQPFIRGLSIGLAAGLVTYAVNAFYHNLMAEFSLFWIVTGFSVALAKLAAKDKGQVPVPQSSTPANSLKKG